LLEGSFPNEVQQVVELDGTATAEMDVLGPVDNSRHHGLRVHDTEARGPVENEPNATIPFVQTLVEEPRAKVHRSSLSLSDKPEYSAAAPAQPSARRNSWSFASFRL
jgi:hypothetical protein